MKWDINSGKDYCLEHRDRLTRFGFVSIEQLLNMQGRRLEVIFPHDTNHDLVDDFIAGITRMARHISGRRHSSSFQRTIRENQNLCGNSHEARGGR